MPDLLEPRPPECRLPAERLGPAEGKHTGHVVVSLSLSLSPASSSCCCRASLERNRQRLRHDPVVSVAFWHDDGEEPQGRRASRSCRQPDMGRTTAMAFCFLHLFGGRSDKLGDAIVAEAAEAGIQATVEAYDLSIRP